MVTMGEIDTCYVIQGCHESCATCQSADRENQCVTCGPGYAFGEGVEY